MAKLKSLNYEDGGKSIFKSLDNKEYSEIIPSVLLRFFRICTPQSINLWHYRKYEKSKRVEWHISISTQNVSFDYGENNKITNLNIIGYFVYRFKISPTIDELIHLLHNPIEMKQYIIDNAKLSRVQKKWLLESNDF